MSKYNLKTLLHRQFSWERTLPNGCIHRGVAIREESIRIPKIQRDYAEGRDSEMIERKRHNLINDMLDVIYGIRKELSFDFVYGYMRADGKTLDGDSWQNVQNYPNVAFEPLDGQQRLTTLFLLYWLFDRRDELRDNRNNHSLFVYETRDTSEEFSHWLVNQNAKDIINNWQSKVTGIKKQNTLNEARWKSEKNSKGVVDQISNRLRFPIIPIPTLFDYMQGMESFKWDWHDDPNIHSMIKVLDATVRYIQERGLSYTTGITNSANLDNITFMLLDNLVCDGDQLFEKMNARGKALTSFEILKSSLEEEMEKQDLPKTDPGITNEWQNAIDGDWIDYCWDNSNIGNNPQLKTVRAVEKKLERLIIRMAGKSFFTKTITGTPIIPNSDAIDYTSLLIDSISKRDCVNEVIERYIDYANHERALRNSGFSKIDFQSIYHDIQNLIYKDSTGWHDASNLLPQFNRLNTSTLLDDFLGESPTHNTRVMIWAMLDYLSIVPAKIIATNGIEKSNFIDWMRFIRNVYNSDNKNSGLDSFDDVKIAIDAIDKWLNEYKVSYRKNNRQDVLHLILNYIKNNPNSQEQARLDEEAIKADLRLNGSNGTLAYDWGKSIIQAENNYYLWGQIIAPLSWSKRASGYDKSQFDSYMSCLNLAFGSSAGEDTPLDALLIQTMLCYQDYRHNLNNDLGSLGRLNNNRDYSWKQYLRKYDSSTGFYGYLFKELMDTWLKSSNVTLSFEDLMRLVISTHKSKYTIKDWQYYIVNISDPNTLLQIFGDINTYGRYVYVQPGGHTFLFRSNTFRTYYRYELLTVYLSYESRLLINGVTASSPAHTADSFGAHVIFTMGNGDKVRLSIGDNSNYNIEEQPSGNDEWVLLYQNVDVINVQSILKKKLVISSL